MRSLLWTLMILAVGSTAQAATITVSADGSGDYPNIQAAIFAAYDGDIIQLGNGVFSGPGNRDLDTDETMVTIESASGDPALCVIDCQGSPSEPHFGIVYSALDSGAVLRGISIINGYGAQFGGALRLYESSITVENCIFSDNSALTSGGAIYAVLGSSPSFQNCVIRNNSVSYYGQGGAVYALQDCAPTFDNCLFDENVSDNYGGVLYAENSGNITFTSCVFSDNSAGYGGTVYAQGSSEIRLYNSSLFSNEAVNGSGVFLRDGSLLRLNSSIVAFGKAGPAFSDINGGGYIVGCTDIFANEGGDWVGPLAGQGTINNNTSVDPQFCDPMGNPGNFSIMPSSPVGESNPCGLLGAMPTDYLWPAPVYGVMSDGNGMYPTIQAAINAVPEGAQISLENGTYTGLGNRDLEDLGKGISLTSRSESPGSVILDLQGSPEDPHRGFYVTGGAGPALSISHLTIRNGYSSSSVPMPYAGSAGAILMTNNSDVTILDVAFENNFADGIGSAIRILGVGCDLDIRDSRFTNHGGTYCIVAQSCGLIMDNCQIDESNIGGIIIDGYMADVVISNSELLTVGLEGLKIWNVSSPVIVENCSFVARSEINGLLIEGSPDVTLTGCSFGTYSYFASADPVGVINSSASFVDCDFTKIDTENPQCRALDLNESIVRFEQCSFSNFTTNASPGIVNSIGGSLFFDYCTFSNNANGIYHTGLESLGVTVRNSTFTGHQGHCIEIVDTIELIQIVNCEVFSNSNGIKFNNVMDFIIVQSDFSQNVAGKSLYLVDSFGDVLGCTFQDNHSNSIGGAIFSLGTILDLRTSLFANNSSLVGGGAIASSGRQIVVQSSTFEGNFSDGNGGAFISDDTLLHIFNCRFEGNESLQSGGAIYAEYDNVIIEDCIITGNTSSNRGGGVSFSHCDEPELNFCLVENNSVTYWGTGVSILSCNPTITNCTIVGNNGATGQIFTESICDVNISQSIIGFTDLGAAMSTFHPQLLTLTTSCLDVFSNASGNFVGPLEGHQGVNNNFSADPIFCQMDEGDYTISMESPCYLENNNCGINIGAFEDGCSSLSTAPDTELPVAFAVLGNHPNPFNPQTVISFELPSAGPVVMEIYDVTGRLVRRLLGGENFPAGSHQVTWDGNNALGQPQSTGVYLYHVLVSGQTLGGKMAMIR